MNTRSSMPASSSQAAESAALAEILSAFPTASGLRVGIDLASVADIEDSVRLYGRKFLDRIFSASEQAYADLAGDPLRMQRYAARFAVKEAAIKALDLGESGISWRDLETVHDAAGRPRLQFGSSVPLGIRRLDPACLAVSLTHHGDCAAAVVLVFPHPCTHE